MANSSLTVGAITVVDGIAGTLTGGWMAQIWLRTNYRALYLLSFWSVLLTLPCGLMLFFGPRALAVPSLLAAEFFLFLNTGPLNAAIVNSVSAPVRATAISINLFCIHFFGDTFSPQIIGAISDHSNLSIGLGRYACVSCDLRGDFARGRAVRAAVGRADRRGLNAVAERRLRFTSQDEIPGRGCS